ncbi:MAG: hemin-degrading factor [Elstera sp.]
MTVLHAPAASPVARPLGADALKARHAELLAAEPNLRRRNAADRLGVSELELLLAGGDGAVSTRLRPEFKEILGRVPSLGPVMVLTRNASVVHEKTGLYNAPSFDGMVGLVLGDDIDLRIFLWSWAHAVAVRESSPRGDRTSLHFFDKAGGALHKIYLVEGSDGAAFDTLVEAFAALDPAPLTLEALAPAKVPLPDNEIDQAAFHAGWDGLQDTHEFHGLLMRYKLARQQALRLAGEERARPVAPQALRSILEAAAGAATPIMVFVGNPGIIQIHTGPVEKLMATGPWFNVLDPAFNLHILEPTISHAWVVYKPTADGTVTSLELFDASETLVASLFGKRKPGQAEDPAWRALIAALPTLGAQ